QRCVPFHSPMIGWGFMAFHAEQNMFCFLHHLWLARVWRACQTPLLLIARPTSFAAPSTPEGIATAATLAGRRGTQQRGHGLGAAHLRVYCPAAPSRSTGSTARFS